MVNNSAVLDVCSSLSSASTSPAISSFWGWRPQQGCPQPRLHSVTVSLSVTRYIRRRAVDEAFHRTPSARAPGTTHGRPHYATAVTARRPGPRIGICKQDGWPRKSVRRPYQINRCCRPGGRGRLMWLSSDCRLLSIFWSFSTRMCYLIRRIYESYASNRVLNGVM